MTAGKVSLAEHRRRLLALEGMLRGAAARIGEPLQRLVRYKGYGELVSVSLIEVGLLQGCLKALREICDEMPEPDSSAEASS